MKQRIHVWLIALIVVALAIAIYAGVARAQPVTRSVSYTVELPIESAATSSLEVPRFDPELGTLRAASLTVTTRHRQDYAVTQLGLGPAGFWWGDGPITDTDAPCYSYLQVNAPSGQTCTSDLNVWPLVVQRMVGFGSMVRAHLEADARLDPVALDLAGLIGAGNATFAVTRSGYVYHSGTTANCVASYLRRIGATVTITYRFNQ